MMYKITSKNENITIIKKDRLKTDKKTDLRQTNRLTEDRQKDRLKTDNLKSRYIMMHYSSVVFPLCTTQLRQGSYSLVYYIK